MRLSGAGASLGGRGNVDPYPNSITVNPSFIYELDGWTDVAVIGTPPAVGWAADYAILHRVDATNYNAVRQTHTLVDNDWYQVTASVLGAYAALVRVGNTAGGAQTVAEFTVAGGTTETVVFQANAATTYLQARSQSNGQDTNLDLLMIEPFTGTLPVIELSALTVAEDASIGALIGTLSTANAPATWGTSTYTITADPDGVFALDGADDTLFEVGAALDYETATSHLVTITDTPSGPFDPISRQFTITVTDVDEARIAGNSIAHATGDSMMEQNVQSTYSYAVIGNGLAWARRLTGERFDLTIAAIDGGSGETAATIRSTRLATALASPATINFLMAGSNPGTSLAQDIADITYMAEQLAAKAADSVCFLADGFPGGTHAGWDSTRIARHADLRDALRLLHDPANGIVVVPTWDAIASTPDGDEPAAGMLQTGDLHPAIPGSFAAGLVWQTAIETYTVARDPYAGETFVATTAMSGANLAGATNDAISGAGLAAGNAASSRMVVDGATTWAELTLNTTSVATCNPTTATIPAGVTVGVTSISSIIKLKLHSGLANVRQLQLRQIKQGGSDVNTNIGSDALHPGTLTEVGEIPVTEDRYITLHTPPAVVAGDATSIRWQLLITPEVVGGVTQTITGLISVAFPGTIIE